MIFSFVLEVPLLVNERSAKNCTKSTVIRIPSCVKLKNNDFDTHSLKNAVLKITMSSIRGVLIKFPD